jgi:hypothetical protein
MEKAVKCSIVILLLFCINNNLFAQTGKSWIEIDSYDSLEGEWEGSAISGVKYYISETVVWETSLNIIMIFNYKKGEEDVSSITKFDFTDFLTFFENLEEVKEEGITKEEVWEMFKMQLGSSFKYDHYSLIYEDTEPADEFFASDSRGRFLMNRNKDELLLIYYEPAFVLGMGDSGFSKMIFRKIHKD